MPNITQGAYKIMLAGQDITAYCQESTIQISDRLGQGPGVAAGSSGRATTLSLTTSLGPAAAAVGAGQSYTPPKLVRQGEIIVYDSTNTKIFGGYVTAIDDANKLADSGMSKVWTNLEAHDYWQDLDRYNVTSETFDGQTDLYIINYILSKYVPSIGRTKLPTTTAFTLGPITFRNVSVQKALQKIADKTGFAMWVSPDKNMHYAAPGAFATAPFQLSQTPDFNTSFQMGFDDYAVDDSSAINRVTFYGGKRLSNDYTQDLSPQANGNLDTLTLAYYPHHASDGHFHVYVGGVAQTVGFYGSQGAANTLIRDGGTAQVLINVDAHTVIFSTAPSNTGANSITAKYRYESPLVVQLVDTTSVNFYGRYLDGTISDETVFDPNIAVQRCRILLNEQSMGLTTLKVRCWRAGIQSGQLLQVTHATRNINGVFLVQEVQVKPLGKGIFEYQIAAGAWHWNLVDFVMTTADKAAGNDTTANETATIADVRQASESLAVHDAWTTTTRTMSGYFFRNTALADGHDLYYGLASF